MSGLPPRVVLIGFMGSGKSTVGRLLARRLGLRFVDTDAFVVRRAGRSIERIFTEDGEEAFRAREAAALAELGRRERLVVATGGGAPAQERNAWFFAPPAVVFHLRVSLAAALERAGAPGPQAVRPILARGPEAVRALFEQRQPLYERLGRGVDTDGRTPLSVAEEISSMLGNPRKSRRAGDSG